MNWQQEVRYNQRTRADRADWNPEAKARFWRRLAGLGWGTALVLTLVVASLLCGWWVKL